MKSWLTNVFPVYFHYGAKFDEIVFLIFSFICQIQLAGLQTLRTVAQAGSAEQPRGESYAWALLLLHKLAADVTSVIYKESKVNQSMQSCCLKTSLEPFFKLKHYLMIENCLQRLKAAKCMIVVPYRVNES